MSALYDITFKRLHKDNFRPIHAGDDYDHDFVIFRAGSSLDLTGAKVWFTVKEKTTDSDSQAKLAYDSTDTTEIEITDATAGKFTIHLKSDDTADLEGVWLYDIKTKLSTDKIIRIARGVIEFLPNITRASS